MIKQSQKVLAFDIGGSKIASATIEFFEKGYKIYDYQKIRTPQNKKELIQKLIELLVYYQKDNEFGKIGIGVPGQIDNKKDVVKHIPNIKGWNNVNLKEIIKKTSGKKAEIDNDVKCFALAENKFGKAKKYRNVVYLAIGTGIGGAIEIDDKLYRGANNVAGEFGHMIVESNGEKCGCGNRGCWQQYVSGKAIEKMYNNLHGKKKKARDIALDSAKGSKKDKKIIKKTAFYLSLGLINIVNIFDPDAIVVGGSVAKEKEILDLAAKEARKKVLFSAKNVKIIRSDLQEEAFLIGAALLQTSSMN